MQLKKKKSDEGDEVKWAEKSHTNDLETFFPPFCYWRGSLQQFCVIRAHFKLRTGEADMVKCTSTFQRSPPCLEPVQKGFRALGAARHR
jgi:hypothetical protein